MDRILNLIARWQWLSEADVWPLTVPDGFYADLPPPAGTVGDVGRVYDGSRYS